MDLAKTLSQIGLSDTQAKVYLACLQLGQSSVMRIAHTARLKRPSVYLILDDLKKMGLVLTVEHEKKHTYYAEAPKRLLTDLKLKTELLTDALPSLEAIHNIDPEKPNIKIADGAESVRQVYNGIFTYLSTHHDEELLIFGSLKDATEHFEAEVINFFYKMMARSKNPIREIGNDDTETRRYYRQSHRLNPQHDIRLIRNDGRHDGAFVETDNMLYGNRLIIFSVKENIFATTIESPTIVATYRTLFNMAWRSGKSL